MTDLSIIIPTYNRLWALPKAVDSCFSEGCKVEIVVVDDGSTDGTWEWLQNRKDVVSIRQDQGFGTLALRLSAPLHFKRLAGAAIDLHSDARLGQR